MTRQRRQKSYEDRQRGQARLDDAPRKRTSITGHDTREIATDQAPGVVNLVCAPLQLFVKEIVGVLQGGSAEHLPVP